MVPNGTKIDPFARDTYVAIFGLLTTARPYCCFPRQVLPVPVPGGARLRAGGGRAGVPDPVHPERRPPGRQGARPGARAAVARDGELRRVPDDQRAVRVAPLLLVLPLAG